MTAIQTRRGSVSTILACALLASGCGPYPRDVEGTLDHVRQTHVIRIGIIDGSGTAQGPRIARSFVEKLQTATGARAALETSAAEPILAKLEDGQIDLAIGPFATNSPWRDDVSIIEPLIRYKVGKRSMGLSAVARNGENDWIMLVEKVTRDAGGGQ